METYGKTVRVLREQRGFLLKEVYQGIVGRSTAFRFERGQTTIATAKLRKIVAALGFSSMDEFFYYHDKQQGHKRVPLEKELSQRMKAVGYRIQTGERAAVAAFYEEYKDSRKKDERFLAYAAHFDVLTNGSAVRLKEQDWQTLLAPYAEEWRFISQYLVEIETWSFRELDWFAFLSSCFEPALRKILRQRYQQKMLALKDFYDDWARNYYNNLINFEMNSIFIGDTADVTQNLNEIEAVFEQDQTLQWELMQRCRILYLRVVMAGLENQPEAFQRYYDKLAAARIFFTGENELLEFYLEQSLRVILLNGTAEERQQWVEQARRKHKKTTSQEVV